MTNVGYATLLVIPSVRGIADELRRQLVDPATEAGRRAGDEGGGGFRTAFEGALAALGVEALAEKAGELFSEAFSQAVEQGDVVKQLRAQLGASTTDAAKYGTVVGQLYSQGITQNFEQGAEAVRAIVNAGLAPPDATNAQLRSIATEMTDVANTFGTEMGLQTQAVSALMKNGLAPSAQSALDVITYGLQKLGPNAEDLLETFQEYPVQLKKLGLDAQTSLGLFQQGLEGGARDTDIVADALKEFSIRSIDMSATSRTAYAQLGLNHQQIIKLEQQIASGGAGASNGLATVLDRLRAIHDPVKRESAAVGLFGTQAEDLGTALFALDPSTAVEKLGRLDGAAKGLGTDLRSGPSYEISVFKRTVQQGLVTFIGGQVLPILARWGKTFDDDVLPPLSAVGTILAASFLPTVQALVTAGQGTVDWLRQWGIWLAPVAILIGGITLALSAEAIASGISTAATWAGVTALTAAEMVTGAYAGTMALLNSIMALNPFVLVAIAVVALAAALVIAWKQSSTFRGIVMAAWQGIQTAAMAAWKNVLEPVIGWLVTGWQAIATGATWLWQTVLAPVFSAISLGARILATVIGVVLYVAFKLWWAGVTLYAGLIMTGLRQVAAVGLWLWNAVLSPVIGWLVAGFKLWWSGVQLYAGLIMTGLRQVAAVGLWLWNAVLSPIIGWLVAGFKLWWSGVQLYVGLVMTGLRALGSTATWLWHSAVQPALNGIGTAAQWLYDHGLKPPLDKGKQLAGALADAFTTAKNNIATEWGKLESIAKKPIAFIIDTVYNKGLVGVWNKVASAFGAPKLGTFKGFATGGILPGYTPGRDVHLAALSGGEAVMRPEWTRAVGPGYVAGMNALAARGGVPAIQRALGGALPQFSRGGIFGWVGTATDALTGAGSAAWNEVKKGASWIGDTIAASARAGVRAVVDPLLGRIPGLDTGWGQMARHVPDHMVDALFGYADRADAGTYDSGGLLRPGLTLAVNGTRTPEMVLTDSQWATAAAAIAHTTTAGATPAAPAAASVGAAGPGLAGRQRLYLVLEDGTQLDAYVDTRVSRSQTALGMQARAGRRQ